MLSHPFYNVVHIVGLVFLMSGLGGMAMLAATGQHTARIRKVAAAFHGVGAFLILLGGFGMLARLGIVQGATWPAWVWVKMLVWGALGAAAFLPYRYPRTALPLLFLLPLLGGLAAYMAIFKPVA